MRLVSREIDTALQKPVLVNFGLYFNKFIKYDQSLVPVGKQTPLNQFNNIYRRSTQLVNSGLQERHLRQSIFCETARNNGCTVFILNARLRTPYISGLGMSHPTETGMVLDHTLGVPYIPAAGQKGLLRLAYMLGSLKDDNGNWLPLDQISCDMQGNPIWEEDELCRTLFGFSDKKNAVAGRLVILDAYPLSQPTLGEDIINPHYGKYYQSQGKERGPTEDQSPVPVKFLVVKEGQEFVFRFLLRHSFQGAPAADRETLAVKITAAMKTALENEGLGAKTAVGYGRFEIISTGREPKIIGEWAEEAEKKLQQRRIKRREEIERKKYPWRPLLRKIEKVDNWGDIKSLILDNTEAAAYRDQIEFTEQVKAAVLRVVEGNRKKWIEERDKQVADWLVPSPVTWESPVSPAVTEMTTKKPVVDEDLLEIIAGLSDWSAFRQERIKIQRLDLTCAQALKEKFTAWKCKKSKEGNRKKAYKQLQDRIKKLS